MGNFLLICFKVRICEISDKSDKFLLNYCNLFWVHFFRTQCMTARKRQKRYGDRMFLFWQNERRVSYKLDVDRSTSYERVLLAITDVGER